MGRWRGAWGGWLWGGGGGLLERGRAGAGGIPRFGARCGGCAGRSVLAVFLGERGGREGALTGRFVVRALESWRDWKCSLGLGLAVGGLGWNPPGEIC